MTIMVCMGRVDVLCPTWELQGRIYSLQTDKGLSYLYSLGCPGSHLSYRNLLRKIYCTVLLLYPPLYPHISCQPSTSNYKVIFKGCFLQPEHSHKRLYFMLYLLSYLTRSGWSNSGTPFNRSESPSSLYAHPQKIKGGTAKSGCLLLS